MTTTDRNNLISQFEILIEGIEQGDTESAVDWLRYAILNLKRGIVENEEPN